MAQVKDIFFRVDASKDIGMGHLMRSLALAECAKEYGYSVSFITIPYLREAMAKIKNSGFRVFDLPVSKRWGWKKDAEQTLKIMNSFGVGHKKWLVLDNYFFNSDYQKFIKDTGAYLAYIDDMADQKILANLLINHGIHAKNLRYKVGTGVRCLLGPKYALLRGEIVSGARNLKGKGKAAKNILVALGGTAKSKNVKKVCAALSCLGQDNLKIKVAVKSNDMGRLYCWADLLFSTASTSALEASLYGLTGVVCVVADNQKELADKFSENGVFLSIGWLNKAKPSAIRDNVERLLGDRKLRLHMEKKARALTDGKGPDRVIKEMRAVEHADN